MEPGRSNVDLFFLATPEAGQPEDDSAQEEGEDEKLLTEEFVRQNILVVFPEEV